MVYCFNKIYESDKVEFLPSSPRQSLMICSWHRLRRHHWP